MSFLLRRWRFGVLAIAAFLCSGAAETNSSLMGWIHFPHTKLSPKLKKSFGSLVGRSYIIDSSFARRLEPSIAKIQKAKGYSQLVKDRSANTLAFGSLDFTPVYGYFSKDSMASRNAAVAVRLGLDELKRFDFRLEQAQSGIQFSSVLRYGGNREGLLGAIGEEIPLQVPKQLSKQVVGYSTFSVKPAQLYYSLIRTAGYLWALPTSLLQLQLRGIEAQLNKLFADDILGEASVPWEFAEFHSSDGAAWGILNAGIQDPGGFRDWLRLFAQLVPMFQPAWRLEPFSLKKVQGYELKGAKSSLVIAVYKSSVIVAPSRAALGSFVRLRSKKSRFETEVGLGWGLRRTAGGWNNRLGLTDTGKLGGASEKILKSLQGVKWEMIMGDNTVEIIAQVKRIQAK